MRAYNIQWDLKEDIEIYGEKECTCLPDEVIIPESVSQDIEDIDEIADFLSDEYGFCVISFDVDDMTETKRNSNVRTAMVTSSHLAPTDSTDAWNAETISCRNKNLGF